MEIRVTQAVNIRGFTRRKESPRNNALSRSLRKTNRLSSLPSSSNQGLSLFRGSMVGTPHSCVLFQDKVNTCGKEGHISVVCKRNPNCIIKWQRSGSSSFESTSVASSRGSAPTIGAPRGTVQMMVSPPAPYSSCSQYYYPPPS